MNTFFSDKIILWRKMTKIWLKIWLKVKENGTKKIKLAKMVAKEKKILVRTLYGFDAMNNGNKYNVQQTPSSINGLNRIN